MDGSSAHGGRPRLCLVACPSGMRYELDGENILVGRHAEADLQLPLPDVSRRHCRFLYNQGRWRVVDLASANGTFVNDQKVDDAMIQPGDHVRIAGCEFVFPEPALLKAS